MSDEQTEKKLIALPNGKTIALPVQCCVCGNSIGQRYITTYGFYKIACWCDKCFAEIIIYP
jgi:hypothetical protein